MINMLFLFDGKCQQATIDYSDNAAFKASYNERSEKTIKILFSNFLLLGVVS